MSFCNSKNFFIIKIILDFVCLNGLTEFKNIMKQYKLLFFFEEVYKFEEVFGIISIPFLYISN